MTSKQSQRSISSHKFQTLLLKINLRPKKNEDADPEDSVQSGDAYLSNAAVNNPVSHFNYLQAANSC